MYACPSDLSFAELLRYERVLLLEMRISLQKTKHKYAMLTDLNLILLQQRTTSITDTDGNHTHRRLLSDDMMMRDTYRAVPRCTVQYS